MDSTLIQPQNNNPSSSKLPIKRKNLDHDHDTIDDRTPPFKFHRIWTEPDEIRFLQGLLDCSSQNLAFPRDLGIFYARFSGTMSQPYTKSQLSEKLRRLRKKFRVISARLGKGMDRSQLSLHDRALYDLSRRLWHPEFAATSPFSGARNVGLNHCSNAGGDEGDDDDDDDGDGELKKSSLVGVKVEFSPTLPAGVTGFTEMDHGGNDDDDGDDGDGVKLSEVNVEFEGEEGDDVSEEKGRENVDMGSENEIGEVAAKAVVNVYDECLKEARRRFSGGESFHARWQQQRIAEFDVIGSRLRLALHHSLTKDTN